MPALPTVAVIGAGSSGIAALKRLSDAGLDVTCFEKGSGVGGNWVFGNDNGMSSIYRSLHINTSRERMEYADFPMPAHYPDFPHHSHIREYFESYVAHFGLAERIRFRTGVEHAARLPDGTWELRTDTGEHRAVRRARRRQRPPLGPGLADARVPGHASTASRCTRTTSATTPPGPASGCWWSGWATRRWTSRWSRSWVAERTFLSARRGHWIIPKYLFGKPLDQITTGAAARLPWQLRQKTNEAILRTTMGRLSRFGLPDPDHGLFEDHPTISDVILSRIAHGEVTPVAGHRAARRRRRGVHRRPPRAGRRHRLVHRLQGHASPSSTPT